MIKQIQLRGISRTPSDRMSEDGGLSESLNMYIDTAESAPALVPEDVTEKLGLPADLQADRIFIHKTVNYENYIAVQSDKVVAYTPGIEDDEPLPILELAEGEKVNDVTSVGNTLIVSTTKSMYYILNKDRAYTLLGNKVPFPYIDFIMEYNTYNIDALEKTHTWDQQLYVEAHTNPPNDPTGLDKAFDNKYKDVWFFDKIPSEDHWNTHAEGVHSLSAANEILGVISENLLSIESTLSKEYIYRPYFIRYELELYDGRLSSIPILINPLSAHTPFDQLLLTVEQEILFNTEIPEATTVNYKGGNYLLGTYSMVKGNIRVRLNTPIDYTNWRDIVKKINIYISQPLPYEVDLKLSSIIDRETKTTEETGSFQDNGGAWYNSRRRIYSTAEIHLLQKSDDEYLKSLLENSSLVFKVKEIPIYNERFEYTDDFKKLSNGFVLDVSRFMSPDAEDYTQLETQDLLTDDDMQHYIIASKKLATYNNSVILTAPTQIIDYDYHKLNGIDKAKTNQKRTISFDVTYILRGYYQDKIIKKHFECKSNEIVYAFQIFPDSRAYKMIVKATTQGNESVDIKYGVFDMQAHPYLDCSYYFGGMDKQLNQLCTESSAENYDINNIDDTDNKIIMSEISNPLVFPIDKRYTFQSKVLGIAVATAPLSQGQFGQFPLYVFTEDGIWAMETASDGSFISQKPLSRDVCVNPDSICAIDNAVVFVTDKAVMMIQGSQAMSLSPYMNGRHYTPNASAINLINNQEGFGKFESVITDDDPFMKFMRKAKVAYDYTGQRLIFISKQEDGTAYEFQYVYKIDTQTWHKIAFSGFDLEAPLNSYPECLFFGESSYPTGKTEKKAMDIFSLSPEFDDEVKYFRNGLMYAIEFGPTKLWRENSLSQSPIQELTDMGFRVQIKQDTEYYIAVFTNLKCKVSSVTIKSERGILCEILRCSDSQLDSYIDGTDTSVSVEWLMSKQNDYTDKLSAYFSFDTHSNTIGHRYKVILKYSQSAVLDLSTALDASTQQDTAKGILITRPFDLGMPDVYKSIKSIKIRGDYDKGNVKYILQGSDNGRDFYTLSSLRGKSWKMFRLFILADLEPTERISWVDIDFEPRYQNKLR